MALKPTPFPHVDADVRAAYAEHLVHEAINYAIEQAKLAPETVGKIAISAIEIHTNRIKASVLPYQQQSPLNPMGPAKMKGDANG